MNQMSTLQKIQESHQILIENYPSLQKDGARVNNIIDFYVNASINHIKESENNLYTDYQKETYLDIASVEMKTAQFLFSTHLKCCVKCCPQCTVKGNIYDTIDEIKIHQKLSQWMHISNIIENWKQNQGFQHLMKSYIDKHKDDDELINFFKSNYPEFLIESKSLSEEVGSAYKDCDWLHNNRSDMFYDKILDQAMKERNLNFLARKSVKRDVAIKILAEHVSSYNDFLPCYLNDLPFHCNVWIAREGSVCIYVEGDYSHVDLNANEVNYYEKIKGLVNVTRFWWD